jgi:Ribbon-helix-helix protein, copG family
MATATKPTGTRIQTWVPLDLAAELKQHAERERRSIGAVIRLAIEDTLVGVPSSRVTARPRRLATSGPCGPTEAIAGRCRSHRRSSSGRTGAQRRPGNLQSDFTLGVRLSHDPK